MYYRIFDCWRLLAAILIMAYHFVFAAPYGAREASDFLHRLFPLLDLFFMISGYFIASRYAGRIETVADYAGFMRRRIARLYPLHLIVTLFFAVVALYAWSVGADHWPWRHDLQALPMHLLALHALGTTDGLALNYPSWSVSAEFFSYALFPLVVFAYRWKGLAGLAGLLVLWLTGLEIASAMGLFPSGYWMTADACGAYRAFADFTTGALIAAVVGRKLVAMNSQLPGIALMAMAVIAMIAQLPPYAIWVLLAASLTATAGAETARPDSTRILAPLQPLTRVSFGIYLWHPVLEFVFLTVLWDRWLKDLHVVDFYVWWLLPMAASIVVAMLSDRYLEPRCARLVAGPAPRRSAGGGTVVPQRG